MGCKRLAFGCEEGNLQIFLARLKILPWIKSKILGLRGLSPAFNERDFRLKRISWSSMSYKSMNLVSGHGKLNCATMQLMGYSIRDGLIFYKDSLWLVSCSDASSDYRELLVTVSQPISSILQGFYRTPMELGELKIKEYDKIITELQTRSAQLKATLSDSKDTSRLQTLREELKYFKRMMPFVKPKDTAFVKQKMEGLEKEIQRLNKHLSQEDEVRIVTESALSTIRSRISEIERARDSLVSYLRVMKIKELAGELPEVDDSVVSMFGAVTDSVISDASINSRWTKYEED